MVLWDLKEELETLLMRLVRVQFINTSFHDTAISNNDSEKQRKCHPATHSTEVHRSSVRVSITSYQQLCRSLADTNVKIYAAVSHHAEGLTSLRGTLRNCFPSVLLKLLRRQAQCNVVKHDYKQLLERRADEFSRRNRCWKLIMPISD